MGFTFSNPEFYEASKGFPKLLLASWLSNGTKQNGASWLLATSILYSVESRQ